MSVPPTATDSHGHYKVLVDFSALLMRFNHLRKVVIGNDGGVDENERLIRVEDLDESAFPPGLSDAGRRVRRTHAHGVQLSQRVSS